MSDGINRMAIRRGSVQSLTLPPFPASIAAENPKLGAALEEWRRIVENILFHSISALKLDIDPASVGVTDAVKVYVQNLINQLNLAGMVRRSGDTMTGPLNGSRMPVNNMELVVKYYVDQLVIANNALFVRINGSTMTGFLTLSADPVAPLHAVTKQFLEQQVTDRVRARFTNTATKTVANTTTPTSLVPATGVGSMTLAANEPTVGTSLEIKLTGFFTTKAFPGDSLTFTAKYGSTTIGASTSVNAAADGGNVIWELNLSVDFFTVGATGTVWVQGHWATFRNGYIFWTDILNAATVTVDTTVSSLVDVLLTWGSANVANSMTTTNSPVTQLN